MRLLGVVDRPHALPQRFIHKFEETQDEFDVIAGRNVGPCTTATGRVCDEQLGERLDGVVDIFV